jgi:hypothetical protein
MVFRPSVIISMFDQEPVGTLATIAIAAHANEHPAAVQPLALQFEFEVARFERALRRCADWLPISAVP